MKHLLPIVFLLPLHLQAAEVVKANNTNTLNLATSWVSGGPPGSGDVAVWDGPISSTLGSLLGADGLSWAGIKVLSPTVATQIRNTAGYSLTLGSAGIDMANATQNFTVAPNLILGSNQTWDIGSGRVLVVSNGISGAGKTMTKSGAGTLRFTGTASTCTAGLQIGEGGVESAHTSGSQELAGPLSGSGALNKSAGGALTISGGNSDFTGTLNLSAGQLNLNHAGALGGATLKVTGGALDNTSGVPLTLAAGSQQTWAGNLGFSGSQTLNLGGSTVTVDGSRTLTVGAGTLQAGGMIHSHLENGGSLTKTGAGTLDVPTGGVIDLDGKLAVTGGTLSLNGGTVVCGISAGAFDIGGATVELNSGSLTTRSITRVGSTAILRFNGATLRPLADSFPFIGNVDSMRVSTGGARINLDGWYATIAPPLLHDPALGGTADGGLHVSDSFAGGVLTISGTNTYTGPTVIEAGTLVLASGASIASSPLIDLGAAGVFDAGSGTTMPAGQTLQGTGEVKGKLTVGAGATLSPGGDTVASMRFSQSLTLAGNAAFQIHKAGSTLTSDRVPGLESVTYGGTLSVTATGAALALGDRFVLFESLSYSGSFTALDLPALPAGLFWETADLVVDGSIKVVNTLPAPLFNPTGGEYIGLQTITITGPPGATIHYTIDGTSPLTSVTRISAPSPVAGIIVSAGSTGFTISAYVSKSGSPDSKVVSAVYDSLEHPTWTFDGGGNWSDSGNWFAQVAASGSGVTADFAKVTLTGNALVTLDGVRTVGSMKFGDLGDSFAWSLAGSALTLAGSSQPEIDVANQSLTTNNAILGNQGFIKTGKGLMRINGDQSLTGPVIVTGGTLTLGGGNSGNGAIGLASSISVTNATIISAGDNGLMGWGDKALLPLTLNTGSVLTCTQGSASNLQEIILAGGDFSSPATNHPTYGSWNLKKNITVSANSTISATNVQASIASPVITVNAGKTLAVTGFFENSAKTAVRPLTKAGEGTMVMSGSNTYTGATFLNGGTLLVDGSLAAASTVTAVSGTTLGGGGSINGTVSINGGATLAPGGNTVDSLSTGPLVLAGTYQCQLDGATADNLAVNGNLTLTGSSLVVSTLNPPAPGSYVIAACTGTRTGTFASITSGYTLDYSTPNQVKLVVAGGGSGFDTWVGGFGLAGNHALPTADPDFDGIANLVEFVLGGNPATVQDQNLLPSISLVTNPGGMVPNGDYMRFTYRRTAASAYLNPDMQYDADLAGIWTSSSGAAGVVQVVTAGFYTSPTPADKVEVFVPLTGNAVNAKLFGRLRVIHP